MAGSDNFTGQNIQDSYQRVLQISSSGELADGTGSLVPLLYVTASHAITEVNYETSSSYAQTASMASSNFIVQGALTASGNLLIEGSDKNYLDGGVVVGVGEDVQGGANRINFDGNEMQIWGLGLMAKYSWNSGFYFNQNGTTGLDFRVETSGDDKALFIDSGQNTITLGSAAGTNITASGDISSSGTITADSVTSDTGSFHVLKGKSTAATGLEVSGYISATSVTASGNISASGDFDGDKYYSNGIKVIRNTGAVTNFGTTGVPSYFPSNITASGDISASGNVYASSWFGAVGGRIYPGGPLGPFIAQGSGGDITSNTGFYASTNITASGNISASGDLYGDDLLANRLVIEGNRVRYNNNDLQFQDTGLDVPSGNITASGNISSSGTITANSLVGTLSTAAQTNITSVGTLGSLTVTGDITANGNIVGDGATQLSGLTHITAIGNMALGNHSSDSHTITGETEFIGHITSSGNISASGELQGNYITAKTPIIQLSSHNDFNTNTSGLGDINQDVGNEQQLSWTVTDFADTDYFTISSSWGIGVKQTGRYRLSAHAKVYSEGGARPGCVMQFYTGSSFGPAADYVLPPEYHTYIRVPSSTINKSNIQANNYILQLNSGSFVSTVCGNKADYGGGAVVRFSGSVSYFNIEYLG